MATVREITIEWGLVQGSGHLSVMYFPTGTAVATQRAAIKTWLTAALPYLASTTSYGVSVSGRELDDQTGTLTGSWTDATLQQGVGTGSANPVADTSQLLVRWLSNTIVNGRFIRGRTFIPGVAVANISSGNVGSAALAAIQTASNTFAVSAAGPTIWHRPIAGSGGSQAAPASAQVWSEFAVLRRRRG